MGRDTEQRVIAYSLLLVAGVTVVGWFAWLVTAAQPPALVSLLIVGSIVLILASVPTAIVGVYLLDRRDTDWPMVARSVAIALVTGVFAATLYSFVWGPDPPLLLAGTGVALLSMWVFVPLAVGATRAATGGVSMVGVLLAWPPANLLGLLLFVAPAPGGVDFARYNALTLAEPARSLLVLLVVATITFGPAVLGRLLDRVITVRASDQPA